MSSSIAVPADGPAQEPGSLFAVNVLLATPAWVDRGGMQPGQCQEAEEWKEEKVPCLLTSVLEDFSFPFCQGLIKKNLLSSGQRAAYKCNLERQQRKAMPLVIVHDEICGKK